MFSMLGVRYVNDIFDVFYVGFNYFEFDFCKDTFCFESCFYSCLL